MQSDLSKTMQCQLCGSSEFTPVLSVDNAHFSSRIKAFTIMRCAKCELSTIDPFPTLKDVEELYVKEGVFSIVVPNPYQESVSFKFLEPLYQKYGNDLYFIASQCWKLTSGNRRVLDVGSGIGRMLSWFAQMPGCDLQEIYGIDIDPQAKTNALPAVRERILIDDFLAHKFDQKFDIITMRFVIEHLLDFKAYLDHALDLLKPGGILFFSTPDLDSAQARQLKQNWVLIHDPNQKIGHVRWFNRRSVHYLADQMGLRIEKYANRGQFIYHLPVPVQKFLTKVLGTEPQTNRFIRYYTPRIIYATWFDGVLSQLLNWGDGLYVFMRKQ